DQGPGADPGHDVEARPVAALRPPVENPGGVGPERTPAGKAEDIPGRAAGRGLRLDLAADLYRGLLEGLEVHQLLMFLLGRGVDEIPGVDPSGGRRRAVGRLPVTAPGAQRQSWPGEQDASHESENGATHGISPAPRERPADGCADEKMLRLDRSGGL